MNHRRFRLPAAATRQAARAAAVAAIRGTAFALALAVAPAMTGSLALAADPKASAFYEDALVRYEKKDYAGAIIQLKNALKLDNKQLPVQVLLGQALLANGEINAAEVAFDEALRLGVNRAELVLPLAQAVLAQGRPQDVLTQPRFADAGLPPGLRAQLLVVKASAASDSAVHRDAVKWIEEARLLDPTRAETLVAEVPIRIRAQQFKEALAAADKAVAMAPSSSNALYQRGTVSHLQGDLPKAIEFYGRTLQAQPAHADGLASRAGVLLDLKRMDEAAKDVAALRKAQPTDPRGAYLAALLAERAGDAPASRRALAEVTALLDPVPMEFMRYRPQLLMLGGLSHFGLNQPEKAQPYLEMAQSRQPGSAVSKLLAQIYLRQKNYDRAIESLDAYLRVHGNDTQAMHLLASVHMTQGRHGRAATLMQEALKKQDDPALRSLLGISLIGSGKLASAAAELEATIKRDPSQIQAGTALSSLYLQSGQVDRSILLAEALTKRQPDNPSLHHLLGTARFRKGDAPGSRSAFVQAAKLAPDFMAPQVALARLDIEAKSWDAATAKLNAVLAKEEKNLEAMAELGRLNVLTGRREEAQRWFEKAESVSGNSLQPGLQLVEFHLNANHPDLAREALKKLTNKAPESLAVLLTQARVQLANTDAVGAKSTLTRATALANFDTPLLVQIASLQLRAGNLPGAAFALDKALAERPTDLKARALAADVDLRQGDAAKAEQRARSLIASDPKLGVGHALLGDVATARGQSQAAIDAYRRAHEIDRNGDSLLRLFGALAGAGGGPNAAAASQLADQWLKSNPGDVKVRRAVADAQARAGNLAAARGAYEALLKISGDDAEAINNLANVQLLQRDPAALKTAERALALRPELPHIIGTVGWAAFQAGQSDRGLQLLRDARLRDPANPDTRYFLGAVLAQRGRTAEARAELEGALRGAQVTAHAREAEKLLGTLR